MHANAHECIYENEESFVMDQKVYTVKTRAFTVYDVTNPSEVNEVDAEIIAIESEMSYKPCNEDGVPHDVDREIISLSIVSVNIEDMESIYSGFTGRVLGKVSNERLRITAGKQGMYNTLYRYKELIENITLDKDKRKQFCQEVLTNSQNADDLLKFILTGCVTEIHERYRS